MKIKPVALVAALAATALALTACSSGTPVAESPGVTKNTIVIGTSLPETGPVAAPCAPLLQGAQAWFDKVNRDGGVNGRKIDYVTLDDAYTATKALSNARQLAQQPVFAFFQACGSIAPPALIQVANQQKIPFLFPAVGTDSTLTGPNFFTMMPSYGSQMQTLIPCAKKTYGSGSVLLVNTTLPGSDETAADVQGATASAGEKYLGTETITVGTPDLGPLALKIKSEKPDYLVFVGTDQDAGHLSTALAAQDALPSKKLLIPFVVAVRGFIAAAGGTADGHVLAASPTPSWGTAQSAQCEAEIAKAKAKLDAYSLFSCAMAQLLVKALKDTGANPTREGLIKTLQGYNNVDASSLLPPVSFTSSNHSGATKIFVLGLKGDNFTTLATIPTASK